jgi:acetylornithine/N-succinyldiaminopimelate aminotransferase
VANAVLDVMLEPGFLPHVVEMSKLLNAELKAVAQRHPEVIEEVRGAGLLLGLKCVVPNAALSAKAF